MRDAPVPGSEVVGRGPELARLTAFLTGGGPALLLTGGPGIGKTTLWDAGIAVAREHGRAVLSARPSGAEAQLAFGGLIDLLDGLGPAALAGLPAPRRAALEVALLRTAPAGAPPEPHAIALGLLGALRALAADGPVLVAVDDLQWLDAPSAEALAFAARRLGDAPVRLLLARRPGRRSPLERALARGTLERLEVGPLDLDATRSLLAGRLGLTLPRRVVRAIAAATLGNPLFTLEVGRTLVGGGVPPIGADLPVPGAVEELLGTRVAGLDAQARTLLLAVALSGDLRTDQLAALAGRDALDDALDAGLLRSERDHVRAGHPLLAAAALRQAGRRERRAAHRALAAAVDDGELRALHLARAADRPDAALASTVAAAAAAASRRGARTEAVLLSEHALRLTPPDAAERTARLLALGIHLAAAGERRRVTDLLTPELDRLPDAAARVRAWLLLADGAGVQSDEDYVRHVDRALAEAGSDPALRANALADKALWTAAVSVERLDAVEAWVAEVLAAGAGARVDRVGLRALGWARALRGQPIDDVCARFRDAAEAVAHLDDSPEPVAGLRQLWRGEVAAAGATFARFERIADERGEAMAYAWMRLNACELGLRTGDWETVGRRLDEWAESDLGELLVTETYQRCRALLAAGRGQADEAARWAAPALAESEALGYRWQVLEARRALGVAALLAHDAAGAAQHLRSVWEFTRREGVDEPGAFPVAPDLVEALVATGALDEARAVGARLRALATAQDHPWASASADRCDALLALATGDARTGAADAVADAAGAFERLGLPFDAARTRLALGRALRRRRKWGAARDALASAASGFDALGSPGWAERARSELARVGARRPRPAGELTPAERRVAELAAAGRSNKEIAAAQFITVRTVEAHLGRVYGKLGVRSRSQLAQHLAP